MILQANAKINLFLEIGNKRTDGYHELESVMQSVTLFDEVEVHAGDEVVPGIQLECSDTSLAVDERNIAFRAAEAFYSAVNKIPRVKIKIKKNIPVAAGLAGGSTDGAAVLRALNSLYDHPLSFCELIKCGELLGADVPFCIIGGTQIARGTGALLTPCNDLIDCCILISKRAVGVSTPVAFRSLDAYRQNNNWGCIGLQSILESLKSRDLDKIGQNLFNSFSVLDYIKETGSERIIEICNSQGGYSLLSGSGPSVFSLFANQKMAEKTVSLLKNEFSDIQTFICRPAEKIF